MGFISICYFLVFILGNVSSVLKNILIKNFGVVCKDCFYEISFLYVCVYEEFWGRKVMYFFYLFCYVFLFLEVL